MSKKYFLGLLVLCFICKVSVAQIDSNFTESFISPVHYKIRLSGSFGELRNNHFHAGIDIKGNRGIAGDSIFSVMSGFVSRIRVQSGGYGRSVYIDHPNGITTVYAHLDRYNDELDKIVENQMLSFKSYEIDYYPAPGALSLNQGDFIGFLGNSGMSLGPHLHFECRDTEKELPIDPLFYSFGITDRKSPFFIKLIIHELDKNYKVIKRHIKNRNTKRIECNSRIIGIGFKGYDQMDGSSNYNGIAEIKLYSDGLLVYECRFDTLDFDEKKYINATLDYTLKQTENSSFFMCYKLPSNKMGNIKKVKRNGLIFLDSLTNIKIVISDRAGNKKVGNFDIVPILPFIESPTASQKLLSSKKSHQLSHKALEVMLPENIFYKASEIDLYLLEQKESTKIEIGEFTTPCHSYYKIEVRDLDNIQIEKKKLQLYFLDNKAKWINMGGQVINDTFYCEANRFGQFKLCIDNVAPKIVTIGKLRKDKNLQLRIKDDSEHSGRAKDLHIDCYVNGTWTPFYYKALTHIFTLDSKYLNTDNVEIRIVVTDACENVSQWQYKFEADK